MQKVIATLLLSFLSLSAQENNVTKPQGDAIDAYYKVLSTDVLSTSHYLDNTLSGYLGSDNNQTTKPTKKEILKKDSHSVDEFFQSKKYLDETDKTYVRIRFKTDLSSKGSDSPFKLKLTAQVPLSKSKSRFKLFLDDVDQDNIQKLGADNTQDQKRAPSLGVNYHLPDMLKMKSKYSLGIRGIYPFVRARYNRIFSAGDWTIEPTQSFRYSMKDYFKEETNVYCDTKLSNLTLLRVQFNRSTQSQKDGMDYGVGYGLFYSPSKKVGMSFGQGVSGNTKFKYVTDSNTTPATESASFGGINNYYINASLRHNVWRPWFFYEFRPGVNFARQYEYKANYTILIYLDFFIGNF